uniref:N-acetylaspartylglutamate synthase A-like n=1 Tax=Jaculus jaculus TaxID=51337 RepID=UPI001E1B53CE|nr:N-acetylaspartylglutamate synthase A-like [Jaculus jaculus]
MCSQVWFLTDRRIREDYPQVQILRALRQRCSEQDVRFRAVFMDQIVVTVTGGHLGGHEDFSKMIDEAEPLGYPVVVKSTRGHQGKAVFLARDKHHLSDICHLVRHDVPYLFQKYVKESHGKDIRVVVVGGQVVGSMLRCSTDGRMQSNCSLGLFVGGMTPKDENTMPQAGPAASERTCGAAASAQDQRPAAPPISRPELCSVQAGSCASRSGEATEEQKNRGNLEKNRLDSSCGAGRGHRSRWPFAYPAISVTVVTNFCPFHRVLKWSQTGNTVMFL